MMRNCSGDFARSNAGQPPLIRGLFYVAKPARIRSGFGGYKSGFGGYNIWGIPNRYPYTIFYRM